MSSLMPAELFLVTIGGGGVRILSSNVFQNDTPPECLTAWLVKALDERLFTDSSLLVDRSPGMPSIVSAGPAVMGPRLGDEALVVGWEGCRLRVSSASPSRTCRMTSASRLRSVSSGAPSSSRAAFIRAKPFDFGCFPRQHYFQCPVQNHVPISYSSL